MLKMSHVKVQTLFELDYPVPVSYTVYGIRYNLHSIMYAVYGIMYRMSLSHPTGGLMIHTVYRTIIPYTGDPLLFPVEDLHCLQWKIYTVSSPCFPPHFFFLFFFIYSFYFLLLLSLFISIFSYISLDLTSLF